MAVVALGISILNGAVAGIWANRYPALWLVPAVVNERRTLDCNRHIDRCRAQDNALDRTRRDVAEDLARYRPDVIVFDRQSPFMAVQFDWRTFLSQSPQVAAELTNYRLSSTLYD